MDLQRLKYYYESGHQLILRCAIHYYIIQDLVREKKAQLQGLSVEILTEFYMLREAIL